MSDLRIEERAFAEGVILDFTGDITKQAEDTILQWRDWGRGLDGRANLLLNFSGVSYINSAGIAALIRLVDAGLKAGFDTYAFGLTSHYQKLFRVVGLTEFLMIYPDEYSLMKRFEESGAQ
jgi:stage II sporulation protein AA (anti-sigma F factor antagonist)